MYVEWSRIYSIFDNDDLLAIPQDQLVYINIKSSQLHLIVAIPAFMPYTDAVKRALTHAKPEERVFNDYIGIYLASFRLEILAKDYSLSPLKRLLSRKFLDEVSSCFNYEQVVKSWMVNPTLFPAQPGITYPISWFREPFSLPAAMFCRLYGEANCTYFKSEWFSTAQHIILTSESFNWAQILSLKLQ